MRVNRIATLLVVLLLSMASCTGTSSYAGPAPTGVIARIDKGIVTSIALASSSKLLAVGSYAGVFVYRTDSSAELWSVATPSHVNDLAWSASQTVLAAGMQDGTILQWDG